MLFTIQISEKRVCPIFKSVSSGTNTRLQSAFKMVQESCRQPGSDLWTSSHVYPIWYEAAEVWLIGFTLTYVLSAARVKQGANVILVVLMLMAVYSHYMVNDKFERIAPALVTFL
jgi:hypothetical protein